MTSSFAWIPITAALLSAVALVHLKWVLRERGIATRTWLGIWFTFLFLISLIGVPLFHEIQPVFFTGRIVFLVIFLTLALAIANFYFIRGLRRESLHEFDLIELLLPVLSIGFAAFVFDNEREPIRLGLAVVASLVFLLAHVKRHHLSLKRSDQFLLFSVFLLAIDEVLVKALLTVIDPVSLYALTSGMLAVIYWLAYQPKLASLSLTQGIHLLGNAVFSVAAMILTWFSFQFFGIVMTNLVLLLSPLVITFASVLVFRERWTMRHGLAFVIILGAILLLQFV